MSDHCSELNEPHVPLRLLPGSRNECEIGVAMSRRFLGIAPDEFVEFAAFTSAGIQVGQCSTESEQVRLLRDAQRLRGFAGVYQLVNGPLDRRLSARYEQNQWCRANNGRAKDEDIQALRAVFIDVDPVRPKGISSTDAEERAAWEVAQQIREWIAERIGAETIGHGASGNGFYLLLAIEPCPPTDETTEKITRFLKRLNKGFAKPGIKIDSSVANPARLMPAPGTLKAKGRNTLERPHRFTSFSCLPTVVRVPLAEVTG